MTVRILEGDVRERLAELPAGSIQCCVTSPPYFGLRDYGTAQWDGGDPACDHGPRKMGNANKGNVREVLDGDRMRCHSCGATRIDRQIGLESTLADYVAALVDVFRQVRRVLRDDGTLWLNLGDSYAGSWGNQGRKEERGTQRPINGPMLQNLTPYPDQQANTGTIRDAGLKPKDLMMVPARVALALQDDGWYLRSDIIWHKPNPMPESVTDRPTSSHEHIFLLTKKSRYYYDADAIREPLAVSSRTRLSQDVEAQEGSYRANGGTKTNGTMKAVRADKQRGHSRRHAGFNDRWDSMPRDEQLANRANARNVWTIATAPYKEAHFATFPPELPRRCILAGTSEKGACPACGAPWVRNVEREAGAALQRPGYTALCTGRNDGDRPGSYAGTKSTYKGWQPSCDCNAGDPVPCVVLDPFAGAGTTLLVADQLGRDAVGIELNPEYARLIERRLTDAAPMFAEVETVPTINQAPLFAEVL